jgi:hypothetical protein
LAGKNLYIIVFFTQITNFFYLSQKHVYWKYNAGYLLSLTNTDSEDLSTNGCHTKEYTMVKKTW